MKSTERGAAERPFRPSVSDLAALFGPYAALAQHPGEDNERLALAIRVMETLQRDAQKVMPTRYPL